MAELASAAPTSGGVRTSYLKCLRVYQRFFNSYTFGRTPFLPRDGAIFFAGSWAVSSSRLLYVHSIVTAVIPTERCEYDRFNSFSSIR
jgi:hypothetical protein